LIKKLHNLKKNQTNLKLMEKSQLESKIEKIDIEIVLTKNKIDTASVEKYGAISDFVILTMHKNTMRSHIVKLNSEKNSLNLQIENIIKEIIELQKETEQFAYILEEEKKEKIKRILLAEEEASSEYMQSKYISNKGQQF
jgi:hypothetical protein